MTKLQEISEAVVAGSLALGTWGGTAIADGVIEGPEWFGLTGVLAAFFGVWAKKNATPNV